MLNEPQSHEFGDFYKNLKATGVNYIGYGFVTSTGKWWGYFSNREWEKIYRKNQFYLYEPLTDILLKTEKPVFFWDMADMEDKKGIMQQRSQVCNVVKGFSLTMPTEKGQSFLSLGFSANHINCLKFFFEHKERISSFFKKI